MYNQNWAETECASQLPHTAASIAPLVPNSASMQTRTSSECRRDCATVVSKMMGSWTPLSLRRHMCRCSIMPGRATAQTWPHAQTAPSCFVSVSPQKSRQILSTFFYPCSRSMSGALLWLRAERARAVHVAYSRVISSPTAVCRRPRPHIPLFRR